MDIWIILAQIETSDALLECQQGLVDLCTLKTALSVVTLGICSPLTAGQVNQQELPERLT